MTSPQSMRVPRPTVVDAPGRHGLSPLDVIAQWRAEGAIERLSTGWPTFDAATRGGFVIGRLAFFLGAPNAHKTATLGCLAWRWLHEGVAVGVLCVDEEKDDFMARLAVMSGVPLDEVEKRSPAALEKIEAALKNLPLKFYGPEWTIEAAAADLHTWMKSRSIKRGALLADSLQTITCDASLDASSLRVFVGANVSALSKAAARHRLAVIATGEIPRAHYDGGDDMRAGKESGAAEYAAKIQCVLRRTKRDDSLIRVSVPKIKRGTKDETAFHLRFDRWRHTLTEDAAPAAPASPATTSKAVQRILEVVSDPQRKLASKSAITLAAGGKKAATLKVVETLIEDGTITMVGDCYRPSSGEAAQ